MDINQNLSDQDEIYGEQFPVENYFSNLHSHPHYNTYQLGIYEKCCVGCGKFWGFFCIGWNVLTCCLFLNKGHFLHKLQTNNAGIVQQFGRFTRMLRPGLNLINPCSEQVISVDLRIKSFSIGTQHVLTKDNVSMTVEGVVYYRVWDPIKVAYGMGVEQIEHGIKEAAFDVIRNSLGEHTLDQILMARNNYIESTKQTLQNKLNNQGICIQNIFLTELELPQSIKSNLNIAARQRRISEAVIITSHAKVKMAELMKQASELLNSKAAMQMRYLEMLQQISHSGKEIKIIMPVGVNSIGKVSK